MSAHPLVKYVKISLAQEFDLPYSKLRDRSRLNLYNVHVLHHNPCHENKFHCTCISVVTSHPCSSHMSSQVKSTRVVSQVKSLLFFSS